MVTQSKPHDFLKFSELARQLPAGLILSQTQDPHAYSGQDPEIRGIALDSRQVKPGELFVALAGGSVDGHRFIADAVQRGAAAVVGSQPGVSIPVPYLQVADGRLALAYLAAGFYDFPGRKLAVVGVTGTDGKTTTANLIFQVLLAAGLKTGMISTVNAVIGSEILDTGFHVTTPEAPDVQGYLARMVAAGLTHVVLEATSHGLAQERAAAVEFDAAVVTNITHEHLDYHGSYDGYRAAKAKLFADLTREQRKPRPTPRGAILNRDDSSYEYLCQVLQSGQAKTGAEVQQISYGMHPEADFTAEAIDYRPDGMRFVIKGPGGFEAPVVCRLAGTFNVSNCLAAAALGAGLFGLGPEAVSAGIDSLPGVTGRMERIDLGQDFTAIVDFAHTPNALKRALDAVRQMVPQGRVIAVFGSAGLRDRAKRRMMAETSAELADLTVLTAEDPRTESLDQILAEMAAGAEAKGGIEGKTFWRVPDRGEAIRFAIRLARPGDVVIACGKGHEQSMCFGETEYLWDDRTAMRAALSEHLGVPGPAMPYLPTSP